LTFTSNYGIIDLSTKVGNRKMKRVLDTEKEFAMSNAIAPQVGSPFTTAVSKVSGIVQEVVANKNGTFRVRLDVAGQPRWTTIK
jgi:hypothetical protein